MIYKIELEERSRRIIEVEAETLTDAIKNTAHTLINQIDRSLHSVVEFSVKEYKGEGAK